MKKDGVYYTPSLKMLCSLGLLKFGCQRLQIIERHDRLQLLDRDHRFRPCVALNMFTIDQMTAKPESVKYECSLLELLFV